MHKNGSGIPSLDVDVDTVGDEFQKHKILDDNELPDKEELDKFLRTHGTENSPRETSVSKFVQVNDCIIMCSSFQCRQ